MMSIKSIKSNRGATLVELMTSIAIFGIIAAAAMGLMLYATKINADVTADIAESGRVYQALDVMKKAVSESSKITVDFSRENSLTITDSKGGVFTFNSEERTLSYKIGEGSEIILLENIESFTVNHPTPLPDNGEPVIGGEADPESGGELELESNYLTISFELATGNTYELTVACKNG